MLSRSFKSQVIEWSKRRCRTNNPRSLTPFSFGKRSDLRNGKNQILVDARQQEGLLPANAIASTGQNPRSQPDVSAARCEQRPAGM
jgi:hypothetical protein